jgi:hypothetical protein
MKLFDSNKKKYFCGTKIEHNGTRLNIYDKENNLIASVPNTQAQVIFNEREMIRE